MQQRHPPYENIHMRKNVVVPAQQSLLMIPTVRRHRVRDCCPISHTHFVLWYRMNVGYTEIWSGMTC
ncbi:hypothetical protein V3C99_004713 [Haemonchus contortus]